MNAVHESWLDEESRSIVAALEAQRQRISARLAPETAGQGPFPRSVTLRLVIQRPALLAKLVELIARSRVAGLFGAVLVMACLIYVAALSRNIPASLPKPEGPR